MRGAVREGTSRRLGPTHGYAPRPILLHGPCVSVSRGRAGMCACAVPAGGRAAAAVRRPPSVVRAPLGPAAFGRVGDLPVPSVQTKESRRLLQLKRHSRLLQHIKLYSFFLTDYIPLVRWAGAGWAGWPAPSHGYCSSEPASSTTLSRKRTSNDTNQPTEQAVSSGRYCQRLRKFR